MRKISFLWAHGKRNVVHVVVASAHLTKERLDLFQVRLLVLQNRLHNSGVVVLGAVDRTLTSAVASNEP